ncbi:MAG: carbon monoxide dehydrogenase [Chloroflexi bacterium]|jgi:hypothetical protein|nr:carbon monoxide dehydrogenase [Chloroflexota bacterium]
MADSKPRIQLSQPVRVANPLAGGAIRAPRRVGEIYRADSQLTAAHRLDHLLARWGYKRGDHRVKPGLYALGQPDADSPVLVTANYTLSFDALRSALAGRSAFILVLDTQGINVWCAAGKGTFGTEELVRRIDETGLHQVVNHRKLILPQLGAPGVSAHEVKKRSGFRVEYGPVRAADLPQYLDMGSATPAMRRVTFGLGERLVLIPIELVHAVLPMLLGAVVLYFLSGLWAAIGAVAATLAGAVLFPLLLPWLPTRDFSSKGLVLGGLIALAAVVGGWSSLAGPMWQRVATSGAYMLGFPAVTAYLALNFTGATPLASKTGVKREMARYIPVMAAMAGVGILLMLAVAIARWMGG